MTEWKTLFASIFGLLSVAAEAQMLDYSIMPKLPDSALDRYQDVLPNTVLLYRFLPCAENVEMCQGLFLEAQREQQEQTIYSATAIRQAGLPSFLGQFVLTWYTPSNAFCSTRRIAYITGDNPVCIPRGRSTSKAGESFTCSLYSAGNTISATCR